MSSSQPTTVVAVQRGGHGCLVTFLWFVFVGWWLSALWIAIAWVLIVLIIPMPIGLMMINALPKIVSLREPAREYRTTIEGTRVRVEESQLPQYPFLLRALYFILIGWWFSAIWMGIAWLLTATFIGMPLGIWMFNRVPAVTTLKRY